MTDVEPSLFNLEISTDAIICTEIDDLLSHSAGLEVHDVRPTDPTLRSSAVETILVAVASAGGVKVLKDVVVAAIQRSRSTFTVRKTSTGTTLTFEGPVKDRREVERLVEAITTADLPRRGESEPVP